MITIEKGNSRYQIFEINKDNDDVTIDIVWGKLDFRLHLVRGGDKEMQIAHLQMRRKHEWLEFKKVTAHGFTYEETKWESPQGETIHVELPHSFRKNVLSAGLEALANIH